MADDVIGSERGDHARRLRGLRGRQRPRPGRRGHRGCHRLLRLHLLRGEHGHAEGAVDRRRQRLRRALRRDRAGRRVHPARPSAVHLRQQRQLQRQRGGQGVHATSTSRTSRRSPRRRSSSRSTTTSTPRPSPPSTASRPDRDRHRSHMRNTPDSSAGPPSGAGLPAARSTSQAKSRPGEAVIKAAPAGVRPPVDRHHVRHRRRPDPAGARLLPRDPVRRLLRHRRAPTRCIPLVTATFVVDRDRADRRRAARARRGDVPLGVRLAAGPQGAQADRRAAGRRAVGRLRLLRALVRHAHPAAGHPEPRASASPTRSPPASCSA